MEKFSEKINKKSNIKISVSEHLTAHDDPEDSFRTMIESGMQCDGLVISGHHTGSFGGERARGSLGIDFLEKLSCEKEYKAWFQKINSLWLQGCRTLGVGKIEAAEEEVPLYDPDYHTQRVGAVLEEDNLEQSFADLNMEFSATLDQDNPLSARYLRLFPKAKVFGWTKTAPGKDAQSERSIPFHLAHISKILEKEEMENPLKDNFDKKQVQGYVDSLSLLLRDFPLKEKNCENITLEGWLHHGQKYGPEPYSLDNPDLQAFSKLGVSSNDDFLKILKIKECDLKQAKTKEEVLNALSALTTDQTMIQHGFNSIWERLQNEKDDELKNLIQNQLKKSPEVLRFIESKLASKQLGLLRKIDYYGFYRDLMGVDNKKIEELIYQTALKQINQKIDPNNYAALDYRITLMQSLIKNRILDSEKLMAIIEAPGTSAKEILEIVDLVTGNKTPIANVDDFFLKIIRSTKIDEKSLSRILFNIGESRYTIPNIDKIFLEVFEKKPPSGNLYASLAVAVGSVRTQVPNAHILLNKILSSDKKNEERVLQGIAQAIGGAKYPIQDAEKILDIVFKSSHSDNLTLTMVANALGDTKSNVPNKSKFLQEIIDSKKSDEQILTSVVFAVSSSENPLQDADILYEKILDSKNATFYTSEVILTSISEAERSIPNVDKIITSILRRHGDNPQIYPALIMAVLSAKDLKMDRDKFINDLLESKQMSTSTLNDIIYALGDSDSPIPSLTGVCEMFLNSKHANNETPIVIANALMSSEGIPEGTPELLKKVIKHSKCDSSCLNEISNYLITQSYPMDGIAALLEIIVNDNRLYDLKPADTNQLIDLINEFYKNFPNKNALIERLKKGKLAAPKN